MMACNCIETKNAELKRETNLIELVTIGCPPDGMTDATLVSVWMPCNWRRHQLDLPKIRATFCPFCGTRYIPLDALGDLTTKED